MKLPLPRRKTPKSSWFRDFLVKVLPTKADDPETQLYKKVTYVVVGMVFLTFVLAFIVFAFSLRGREETMIPKVVGEDVITAIQELQDKALVPRIQTQYSNDPRQKGTVVSQDPQGGILVREGRKITLWVSKGAVIDKVENYLGQNLNDVELHLRSLFATQTQAIVTVENTPTYVWDSAPDGTILQQKPAPGTPITGDMTLRFVVSRGPRGQMVELGSYAGQDYLSVMNQLASQSIPFVFKARSAEGNEQPGRVVAQDPAPTVQIPRGTSVTLTMTQPKDLPQGSVFGLFQANLPQYPILVALKLEDRKTNGDSTVIVAMKHPGGPIAIPYVAPLGDTLVLSILGKDILTQTVGSGKAPVAVP